MNTPAIETIDVLCQVVELQTEIIKKQAFVIEQSNIDFDGKSITALKEEADAKLEQVL